MHATRILASLGALATCLGLANVGRAADNCSGTSVYVLMHDGNAVVILNDDHSAPDHMAVGSCDATVLRCTYKDKDGDTWTDDVAAAGTWKTVVGTGKYAKSKSSGWSKTIRMEIGPEGTIYIGAWGGECNINM
ncbi:MAG TPA: hypothetical protein VMH26_12295 [Burkholderiales bacterium]|nr:hypothetical protein [Burkholderiales bacterium]